MRTEELKFVKESELEGKAFFVFKNTNDEYRVVEAESYRSFSLHPGTTVLARVRKKGCAGEEISELLHPDYTEGGEYLFKIVRTGSVSWGKGKLHFVAVADDRGTEYKITTDDPARFVPGDSVKCHLIEQVQGRLKFSIV